MHCWVPEALPLQGLMPPYGPLYGETANGSLSGSSRMTPCDFQYGEIANGSLS